MNIRFAIKPWFRSSGQWREKLLIISDDCEWDDFARLEVDQDGTIHIMATNRTVLTAENVPPDYSWSSSRVRIKCELPPPPSWEEDDVESMIKRVQKLRRSIKKRARAGGKDGGADDEKRSRQN